MESFIGAVLLLVFWQTIIANWFSNLFESIDWSPRVGLVNGDDDDDDDGGGGDDDDDDFCGGLVLNPVIKKYWWRWSYFDKIVARNQPTFNPTVQPSI